MPRPENLEESLRREEPEDRQSPSDNISAPERVPEIDLSVLSEWLMSRFRESVIDKAMFGWYDDRIYDYKAYYGLKDEFFSNWPWPNASNFHEPITPVLLDTAWAAIQNSMFPKTDKIINVKGWAAEDAINASRLEKILNFQNVVEAETYNIMDLNTFRTLFNGTSFVKTFIDWESDEFKLRHACIPAEYMHGRIRSNGLQVKDTDFVIQIIPLTDTEYEKRKNLKINGKKYYDNFYSIPHGVVFGDMTLDAIRNEEAAAFGLDVSGFDDRSRRYIAEAYCTFYPMGSMRPLELVVSFAPSNGAILHYRINEDKIRPFSDYYLYPNPGAMFHMSLPKKIKDIQLKANYVDKQVTDAADKAISQPGYLEEGSRFAVSRSVRVPSGMYEIKAGSRVTFENVDMAPIVERGRQIDALWDKAERLSGFTDLYQGTTPDRRLSATTDTLRFQKSEGRVGALVKRYSGGWKKTCELSYFYNDRQITFEKKNGTKKHIEKIQKIIGFDSNFSDIDQVFPSGGYRGRYDFLVGGSEAEVENDKKEQSLLLDKVLPIFGKSEAIAWSIFNKQAELINFTDFKDVVPPPREADVVPVEKMLSRIEGGEKNVIPSPLIDTAYYMYKLKIYTTTSRFDQMEEDKKREIQKLIQKVEAIQNGKAIAMATHLVKMNPNLSESLRSLVGQGEEQNLQPEESLNAPVV